MSTNILDRKIPSLAGLGVLLIGIIATTYLVKGPSLFEIRANPASEPKNVQITNISDSSFTVIYTTDDSVIGTLTYGQEPDQLNSIGLDERDQLSQKVNKYNVHSITLNNLTPDTTYYFAINSGSKTIKNNEEPFSVTTGPSITSAPTNQTPMAGRVLNPEGKNVVEGLVTVNINGAQKISSLIRDNGNYTVPLNNLRTTSLNKYYNISENQTINMTISSENLTSTLNLAKDQISPVPVVTLSKSYDFSKSRNQIINTRRNRDVTFPEFDSEIRRPSPVPELSPTPEITPTDQI
jgi:hypothetical protein